MPSGLFILQRFYLRVDDVLIRINDTRVYFERGANYILREYTSRESRTKDLKVADRKIIISIENFFINFF